MQQAVSNAEGNDYELVECSQVEAVNLQKQQQNTEKTSCAIPWNGLIMSLLVLLVTVLSLILILQSIAIHKLRESPSVCSEELTDITERLSNLENDSITTEKFLNTILLLVEEVQEQTQNSSYYYQELPESCQDVQIDQPNSPSGYYRINGENVYCEMGELCGSKGGWSQLAYLNMSDSTANCPIGFQFSVRGSLRTCGRPTGGASCVPVMFPSNGISYSEVCGKVVGYQYGSPDAVDGGGTIDSYYVEGISITRGYPREHVWTLMAGSFQSYSSVGNCPCNTPPGSSQSVPAFIGNDYFCESGNPSESGFRQEIVFTDDPLWDGNGCGTQERSCCSAPGLPWFHKTLNSATDDYLELRDCGDHITSEEDVLISYYEIYVK